MSRAERRRQLSKVENEMALAFLGIAVKHKLTPNEKVRCLVGILHKDVVPFLNTRSSPS